MPDFESLIKLLQNDDPNKRYEACEELRVSQQPLPQEAIDALNLATNDPNPDVADAAQRALALHTQVINEPELGQEQDKAFTVADLPKTNFDKLFERRSSRALLFIGFLIVVLVINELLAYIIYGYFEFPGRLLLLSSGIPVGLYLILSGGYVDEGIMFFYFVCGPLMSFVYIAIMANGIGSRNWRTSKFLFYVYTFLLTASLIVSLLNDG